MQTLSTTVSPEIKEQQTLSWTLQEGSEYDKWYYDFIMKQDKSPLLECWDIFKSALFYWKNHVIVWENIFYVINWEPIIYDKNMNIVVDFSKRWSKLTRFSVNENWDVLVELDNSWLYKYNINCAVNKEGISDSIERIRRSKKWDIPNSCLTIDSYGNIYYLALIDWEYYINFNWTAILLKELNYLEISEPPFLEVKAPWKFDITIWIHRKYNKKKNYIRQVIKYEKDVPIPAVAVSKGCVKSAIETTLTSVNE